jgi:hypothetical protein
MDSDNAALVTVMSAVGGVAAGIVLGGVFCLICTQLPKVCKHANSLTFARTILGRDGPNPGESLLPK